MERKITRTRRFKALIGNSTPSRIVNKISLYDQNDECITTRVIEIDKEGREYYYMPNFYNDDKIFSDRPKDAIESIRAGYGDVISCGNIFGSTTTSVIRFVDRTIGEELRQKCIDGWKDTIFAYGIKFGYKNSISDGYVVDVDDNLIILSDDKKVLYFKSEEDTQSYIDKMIKKAKYYSEEYNERVKRYKIPESDVSERYEKVYKPYVEKINKIIHFTTDSLLWRLFAAENENSEYYCKVIQVII